MLVQMFLFQCMVLKKAFNYGQKKILEKWRDKINTNFYSNFTVGINAVDTSRAVVQHSSAYDTGNGAGTYVNDVLLRTRQVYLNTSTQLVGQARNSVGSGSSLTSAGAGQVTEYYA